LTLGAAVAVVNAGTVSGTSTGTYLRAGGSVTNQSGATISGGNDGILTTGAAVTVVNAGTITGGSYAVDFAAGYANRLVIDPNAVFSGTVTGGNAIGAAQVSTLELASAGSVGTLSGFGTKYVDFAQVTLDAGAQWTLQATDTIEAGAPRIAPVGWRQPLVSRSARWASTRPGRPRAYPLIRGRLRPTTNRSRLV
jgi:hypothetical protein